MSSVIPASSVESFVLLGSRRPRDRTVHFVYEIDGPPAAYFSVLNRAVAYNTVAVRGFRSVEAAEEYIEHSIKTKIKDALVNYAQFNDLCLLVWRLRPAVYPNEDGTFAVKARFSSLPEIPKDELKDIVCLKKESEDMKHIEEIGHE